MSPPKLKMFFYRCLLFAAIAPLVATRKFSLPPEYQMHLYLKECIKMNGESANPFLSKCFLQKLGIWSDEYGYNVQRILDIYPHKRYASEVRRIVRNCNISKKATNPDTWAHEAILCSNVGKVREWIEEFNHKEIYDLKEYDLNI
ncbi:hypothetical protein KR018_005806 [Drosophila ironensis]|nr:hypothetical protein KR018_005806 [Drosophila ironensis]